MFGDIGRQMEVLVQKEGHLLNSDTQIHECRGRYSALLSPWISPIAREIQQLTGEVHTRFRCGDDLASKGSVWLCMVVEQNGNIISLMERESKEGT